MLNSWALMSRRRSTGGGSGGGTTPTVNIVDGTYYNSIFDVDPTACTFELDNDGTVDTIASSKSPADYTYLITGAAADLEVRADIVSGTVSTGSDLTGTWLSLSTDRKWQKYKAKGVASVLLTVRIRRASDFVEIDSASISLTYEGNEWDFGGGGGGGGVIP